MRYIADSRYITFSVVTCMSDDLHSDAGGETLEELRIREKNSHLAAITPEQMSFREKRYRQSLFTPFQEITGQRYSELFNGLPPLEFTPDCFFAGGEYYNGAYLFCFTAKERYFCAVRPIKIDRVQLDRQIREHIARLDFHPAILKGEQFSKRSGWYGGIVDYTPYSFVGSDGKPKFISNLCHNTGNDYDDRSNRNELAGHLSDLRRNLYRYITFHSHKRDLFKFFEWVRENKYTIQIHGELFYFNADRDFVDFSGNIIEYSAAFLYRIYSREVLQYVINQLRTVKRKLLWER